MKTVNINSPDENIYKFDKKKFFKSHIPYMALFTLSCAGIYLIASLISSLYDNYEYLLFVLLLVATSNIATYFRMHRLARTNYFKVQHGSFSLHKFGYAFESRSTIHEISSLRKTPSSIIVRGTIDVVHLYYQGKPEPDVFKKKRLRIPAYFENMDEIYKELEKMKG